LTALGGYVSRAINHFIYNADAKAEFKREYRQKMEQEQAEEEAGVPPEQTVVTTEEDPPKVERGPKRLEEGEVWFSIFRSVKKTNKIGGDIRRNEDIDLDQYRIDDGSFFLDTTQRARRVPTITDISAKSGPAMFRRLQLLEFPVSGPVGSS
jgi:hypothetical protein